jgi:ferrous iron transport protein B
MNFLDDKPACHGPKTGSKGPKPSSSNMESRSPSDRTVQTDFIALVGSPNCGKTTLFNRLTGMSADVVNYPGATVDYIVAPLNAQWGTGLRVVDTPGTYSLFPKSPEEKVAVNVLFDTPRLGKPKAVVCVADSTQLSRHLFLLQQLKASGFPVMLALTMGDLASKEGFEIDAAKLSQDLGVEVVCVDGRSGRGLQQLVDLSRNLPSQHTPAPLTKWPFEKQWQELQKIAVLSNDCRKPVKSTGRSPRAWTRWVDNIVLHPALGLLVFCLIMGGMFSSVFWMAAPLMEAISVLFDDLARQIIGFAPNSLWADLIGNGLVVSIGAVMVFTPQIFILFVVISILEDSGYLARAASLVDKPLSRIGLNGRSFVPLLSGYACAIPAMMAARTIPSRKERFLTLLIIPLMSCSARLPVFALLLGFLFWGQPAWQPGLALAGIYFLSLLLGAGVAAIVRRRLKFDEKSFFILELPVYRAPNWRAVLKSSHQKTLNYVLEAGPVIFTLAVLLWAATTFPNYDATEPSAKLEQSFAAKAGRFIDPLMEPMGGDWRTGVALISAFAAREVFVSALAVVFHAPEADEDSASLLGRMQQAKARDGTPLFNTASIWGLIVFFMIALQCMATVAVARREFGNWKYPMAQLIGFNVLAYVAAVAVVQTLLHFGIT